MTTNQTTSTAAVTGLDHNTSPAVVTVRAGVMAYGQDGGADRAPVSAGHTPGPWASHPSDQPDWWLVTAKSGRIVANVNCESCPDTDSAPAFVKMPAPANARLIAAAPELLAALELIHANAAESAEWIRSRVATAIAKAGGSQ